MLRKGVLWIVGLLILGWVLKITVGQAQTIKHSIAVSEITRHYQVYEPESYSGETPLPVVMVLHGGGSRGRAIERLVKFQPIADREGFLVVYPDAQDRLWNDGRATTRREDAADVNFLSLILDELSQQYPIDSKRVYATGISNGGFMTQRLACELTDRIAAVATVDATMPQDLAPQCQPSRPVSVLIMAGTEDPFVPYEGGSVQSANGGKILSVPDSAQMWAQLNGCSLNEEVTPLPNQADDGTRIEKTVYPNCRAGSNVVLYTVDGGGHTWPGGPQYLPQRIIGKTSQDINASEVIWSFFESAS